MLTYNNLIYPALRQIEKFILLLVCSSPLYYYEENRDVEGAKMYTLDT